MKEEADLFYEWPSFIISDLKQCRKNNSFWEFDVRGIFENQELKKTINFKSVFLQGFITQKPCDDVLILQDFSGKVKLTNCTSAIAESDNLIKGSYCTVDGTLVSATGLPEISTYKIKNLESSELSNDFLFQSWPWEVKDFKHYVLGILKPNLEI